MPRRASPPRLWFRENRQQWVILDKGRFIGTGCGQGQSEEAARKLQAYLTERHTPEWGDGRPSQVLVADILGSYAEEKAVGTPSAATISYHITTLLQFFGEETAAEISTARCRAYLAARVAGRCGRPVKPHTAARELTTLRAALNHAHRENRLSVEVVVPKLASDPVKDRCLTRREIAELLLGAMGFEQGSDGRFRRAARQTFHIARFILLAYYTATRHEACATLRWVRSLDFGSIDLEAGVFHRRGTRQAETNKRRPPARLPYKLLPHCQRWRRLTSAGPVEWKGKVCTEIRDGFAQAAARARIGGITPHTLKHTAITHMLQAGVSIWDVAGFTGTSVSTIEKVYGHHSPGRNEAAVRAWR